MLRCGFILALVASAYAEAITVGDKWINFIPNELIDVNKTWSLSTGEGSTIKVFCPDFRFPYAKTEEEACKYSKIKFDDGVDKRSVCGTQYDFQVIGKSSEMVIELILPEGSAGHMECLAKAVNPPKSYEEVTVSPSDGIKRFKFPEVLGEDNDKAWRFKSTSDKKISLQCEVRSEREDGGVCIKDIITVDNGEGPKQQCGYDDVVAISSGKEITLRVETFPTTQSSVDCKVQTISGANPNEFENVEVAEQDSSEHGVVPGKKGTTCECGKANQVTATASSAVVATVASAQRVFRSKEPNGVYLQITGTLQLALCEAPDASHRETQRLTVKKVSIPKEWFDGKGLAGDIAVLHLENPIRFSKWVSPVCLTPDEPDIINKYIKHMGWGYTENGYPDKLREADVQVLDKAVCNNNPKEVCFGNGPSTQCFGDSGGPFVFADPETNRYTQVGLASYVYGMCTGRFFIATNTVHWYDWVKDAMAETSTEHSICRKVD